jgi:hypothetical protein
MLAHIAQQLATLGIIAAEPRNIYCKMPRHALEQIVFPYGCNLAYGIPSEFAYNLDPQLICPVVNFNGCHVSTSPGTFRRIVTDYTLWTANFAIQLHAS